MINKGKTTRNPQKTLFKFLAGVSKTIAAFAVATAFRVLYWWKQQISNGCLEIFKTIITLLTLTVLFLFTFFKLILDAHRTKGCAAPGGVYTTRPELSLDLSTRTLQWLVLVLDSIREIGSSILLNIYFEICWVCAKKDLGMLSVR